MKTNVWWAIFLAGWFAVVQAGEDLYTNVYVVPPNFLEQNSGATAPLLPEAKKILESAGIRFQEGASAFYNPASGKLIVRNTEDQMELVRAFLDSMRKRDKLQVHLALKELVVDPEKLTDFEFLEPPAVSASKPAWSDSPDSIRAFKERFSKPPIVEKNLDPPLRHGIAGVFTDPQFQFVARLIEQSPDAQYSLDQSLVCRSGQPALLEAGERRWGIIPVVGADRYTIDLSLFLPEHGEALPGGNPSARVTVWDGQTVAYAADRNDGKHRIVFITAQLGEPSAGQEAKKEEHRKEVGKATPKEPEPIADAGRETPTDSINSHIVREGETLFDLARRYDLTTKKLQTANQLKSDFIEAGQLLVIPSSPEDSRLGEALRTLIIPSIDFRDVPFRQALGIIQNQILGSIDTGLFPDMKCGMFVDVPNETAEAPITLRLRNVPAVEALRYTTALARCTYRIDKGTVIVSPVEKLTGELGDRSF